MTKCIQSVKNMPWTLSRAINKLSINTIRSWFLQWPYKNTSVEILIAFKGDINPIIVEEPFSRPCFKLIGDFSWFRLGRPKIEFNLDKPEDIITISYLEIIE